MSFINNYITDYFEKRPQLKHPNCHFGTYEIPVEWEPLIESLIDIAENAKKLQIKNNHNYIRCSVCGHELKFDKKNSSGQSLFKPCNRCKHKFYSNGYGDAQKIYKTLYHDLKDQIDS